LNHISSVELGEDELVGLVFVFFVQKRNTGVLLSASGRLSEHFLHLLIAQLFGMLRCE